MESFSPVSSFGGAALDYGTVLEPTPTAPTRNFYSPSAIDYVDQFYRRSNDWLNAIGPMSAMMDMMSLPSFRDLVAMGEKVVPLILQEIRHRPSFLFLVLHEITGENPIPPTARGNIGEMISAWLSWGERNNIDAY